MTTNFWDDEEGNEIKQESEFVSGGGDFEVIPKNTTCLAVIEEISWKEFDDGNDTKYIEARWSILQPDDYSNRKIFQKICVFGKDQSKSDFKEEKNAGHMSTAKRMLASIDMNAGGKLYALGKKPTDEQLQKALINKPMMITLQVWKTKDNHGDDISGNWVSAVAPKVFTATSKPAAKARPEIVEDDDIPFN